MSTKRESRRQLWRNMRRLRKQSAELAKALPVAEVAPMEDPTVLALRKMVRLGRAYHMVVR